MNLPPEAIEEEQNFNDMYDIVKAIIKVHSKHDVLNEDYTIANLNPKVLQNPLIIYIKDNINILVGINNYLSYEDDKQYKEMINGLLLDEVTTLTNLSRAESAKVLNAILRYIEGQGNIPQTPTTEENTASKGFIAKQFEKLKKKPEVE